jgi:hypothetical protein
MEGAWHGGGAFVKYFATKSAEGTPPPSAVKQAHADEYRVRREEILTPEQRQATEEARRREKGK